MVKGGIQQVYVTKIKTSARDDTISISHLSIKSPNGDYDGDCMWMSMLKEMDSVEMFQRLHPCTTLLTDQTLRISSIVNIGVQATTNLNAFMRESRSFDK